VLVLSISELFHRNGLLHGRHITVHKTRVIDLICSYTDGKPPWV